MDKMNQNMPTGNENTPQESQPTGQGDGEPTPAEGGKKPMGPIVGVVIIVIVLIFGGLYFWGAKVSKEKTMTAEEITAQEDVMLIKLKEQSESDEIADIEADLNATDLEGLDAELEQIDQDLSL